MWSVLISFAVPFCYSALCLLVLQLWRIQCDIFTLLHAFSRCLCISLPFLLISSHQSLLYVYWCIGSLLYFHCVFVVLWVRSHVCVFRWGEWGCTYYVLLLALRFLKPLLCSFVSWRWLCVLLLFVVVLWSIAALCFSSLVGFCHCRGAGTVSLTIDSTVTLSLVSSSMFFCLYLR